MVSRVEASPRDGVAAIDSFRSNLDTGTLMALAIGLTLTMLVGGCAAPYDAKYPYEQGWRLGEVVKTGQGIRFESAGMDCRSAQPSAAIESNGVAYVQVDFRPIGKKYPHSGPSLRYMLAPIPKGVEIGPGDTVYVNIRDCSQAIVRYTKMASSR